MEIKYSHALHNNASLKPVRNSLTMQAAEKGLDWDHKINVMQRCEPMSPFTAAFRKSFQQIKPNFG